MINTLNNHPLGRLALLFGLGVVLVIVFIFWGNFRRKAGLEGLERIQRQLQFSSTGPVTPSAEVLQALKQANSQLERLNATYDKALFRKMEDDMSVATSVDSTSAYFEIAEFVESMAQRFESKKIALPDRTRFGFMQFEQQGPDAEILPGVLAQKTASRMILEPLLTSRPVALTGFKREYLQRGREEQSLLQQAAGNRSSRLTQPEDTIEAGSQDTGFESYLFELVFEGHTESLRQYLTGISDSPMPILVKELEVVPLDRFGAEEGPGRSEESANPFDLIAASEPPMDEAGPVPIIRNNLSSFRLLLEVYFGKEPGQDA